MVTRRPDERQVVQMWEAGQFDTALLEPLGLRLMFRGVPSDAGGPDYQDALFSFDGRMVVQGDVEFHVRASDWHRHGHDRDAAYNRVALHVVWEDDGVAAIRQDGRAVPTLALALPPTPFTSPVQKSLPVHPCVVRLAAMPAPEIAAALRLAAARRFKDRVDRFGAEVAGAGADDVAFVAVLEAMGYASNRSVFRRLAEVVPYGWLMAVPARLRADALLAAAGLEWCDEVVPPARLPPGSWRISRLRPGNHPAVRLRAVAALLARFAPSLAEGLAGLILSGVGPPAVVERLTVRDDDGSPLGRGRAIELAVSVVIPLAAALAPERSEPGWLLRRFPSPPSTRWTRSMAALIREAGREVRPRGALDHQGLHALYTEHCRYGRTTGCPVCGGDRVAPAEPEAPA